MIVLIRTVLSMSIQIEIEGTLPQAPRAAHERWSDAR